MKTILAILFAASFAACSAQDTPSWWPPPLDADSVPAGRALIYERPLASFNHPDDGRPRTIVALRDAVTGRWWRVVARHEEAARALPGDTVTIETLLP